MPKRYAYNTSATQVKKRYAMIGSTATQVKKRYAMIGSTATLVYSAEVVVFDGTNVASGYTVNTDGYNKNTVGIFYAKSRYNSDGGHRSDANAHVAIDCTNFSKITVSYSYVANYYGNVQIGLFSKNPNVSGFSFESGIWRIVNADNGSSIGGNQTGSGTVSFNLDNVTGTHYLMTYTYNTQGNQTDAIITKIVLE